MSIISGLAESMGPGAQVGGGLGSRWKPGPLTVTTFGRLPYWDSGTSGSPGGANWGAEVTAVYDLVCLFRACSPQRSSRAFSHLLSGFPFPPTLSCRERCGYTSAICQWMGGGCAGPVGLSCCDHLRTQVPSGMDRAFEGRVLFSAQGRRRWPRIPVLPGHTPVSVCLSDVRAGQRPAEVGVQAGTGVDGVSLQFHQMSFERFRETAE